MSAPLSPIPSSAPVVETDRTLSRSWFLWLYEVWLRIGAAVGIVGTPIAKVSQSASIGTTTAYAVVQNAVYRVSYYLRVTLPASVSSSLTPTIGWKEGGVTRSQDGAAVTGNLVTSQENGTLFVRADAGTVITYAVLYASSGTPMQFACDVAVELVN